MVLTGGGGGGGAIDSQSPLIFSFSATFRKDCSESCVTLTCKIRWLVG